MKKDDKEFLLRVSIEDGEVCVRGDSQGLTYLSEVCRGIIGKTDPSGHMHIDPRMGNASAGSLPMIVEFTDNLE